MQALVGISTGALRTARNHLKDANLIDFIAGGQGYRVRTRYQILTPIPDPNPQPIQDPNPEPIPYNNKIKIKTKINNDEISKNLRNERFSKREYVTSGSDFD
jgi:hypothetical protein